MCVDVFEAARRFSAVVIVTKDKDFADLVVARGMPPQVVWLRCGNLSTIELEALLAREFPEALRQLATGAPLIEI